MSRDDPALIVTSQYTHPVYNNTTHSGNDHYQIVLNRGKPYADGQTMTKHTLLTCVYNY